MLLSSCYRTITAIFNQIAPVQSEGSRFTSKRGGNWKFRQGPFEYFVSIIPGHLEGVYDVEFYLENINTDRQGLKTYLEGLKGKPLSEESITNFIQNVKHNSIGILNSGQAFQVMGTVVNIIQRFVLDDYVTELRFSSDEPSRTDLYRRMLKRFFPGNVIKEKLMGVSTFFQVHLDSWSE